MNKRTALGLACMLGWLSVAAFSQQVMPLYSGPVPGSNGAGDAEKEYFSKRWNTEVVSNVSQPSLTVFKPAQPVSNGTAVVICPGGGFMALSIESEGIQVAKWLADRGVVAFVLKYRLVHTNGDATEEFETAYHDREAFGRMVRPVVRLAIDDGLAAVAYVRKHAAEYGISPERVGIMGFSAGGTVTAGVALHYTPESRPAFVAPIYAAAAAFRDNPVPADAPPLFAAAASDDQLALAPDSVGLYNQWMAAHKSAELHMYAKGGHGFGMRKQGLPSDEWIDRFAEWLAQQGFLQARPAIPSR